MMAQGLIRKNMVDANVDLIAKFLHKALSLNSAKNPARNKTRLFGMEGWAPARPCVRANPKRSRILPMASAI